MTDLSIAYTLAGGSTTYSGLALQPGDAVLWFLRLDDDDTAPSGRLLHLAQGGETVANEFYTSPSGWANYVTSVDGTWTADGDEGWTVSDTVYVIFDHIKGFTAGTYDLVFDLPAVARARVEAALILRGVIPTEPGTLHDGWANDWSVNYGESGTIVFDGFPASIPLAATQSLILSFWQVTFSSDDAAGYTTVPGTELLRYAYTNPDLTPTVADMPIYARTDVISVPGAVAYAMAAPTTGGVKTGRISPICAYYCDALVLNGGVMLDAEWAYTLDVITFNATSRYAKIGVQS